MKECCYPSAVGVHDSNSEFMIRNLRRWLVSQEPPHPEELKVAFELFYAGIKHAAKYLGETTVDASRMTKAEAEKEIFAINELLERAGELNLPEATQISLAADRDAIRAHLDLLNKSGLDSQPNEVA